MEQLPLYIQIVFALCALFTLLLFNRVTNYSKPIIVFLVLWLVLQSALGLSGFYTVTDHIPPRFSLLIAPPIILIAVTFSTKSGRILIDGFDIKILTLLHIVRIPVELTLYWLCLNKVIPEIMTFEGRNFDILSGITAPFIYYFGYVKNVFGRKILMVWNVLCLLLLINIVVTAVLSAPFPFQQFAFDQPNIALLYFPFVLLPGFVVPMVLFAHLVAIRKLMVPVTYQ